MSATYVRAEPSQDQRAVAADALTLARLELGLPPISIHWFRDAATTGERMEAALASVALLVDHPADAAKGFVTWEEVAGLARQEEPGTIWLNVCLAPRDLARTTLHEARHRWQHRSFGWPQDADTRAMYEWDASRYAETRVPEG